MGIETNRKIRVSDVAQQTGISAPLIRKLMRDEKINIGFCTKHGDKWYYYIIEKDLRAVFGDQIVNNIKKGN